MNPGLHLKDKIPGTAGRRDGGKDMISIPSIAQAAIWNKYVSQCSYSVTKESQKQCLTVELRAEDSRMFVKIRKAPEGARWSLVVMCSSFIEEAWD